MNCYRQMKAIKNYPKHTHPLISVGQEIMTLSIDWSHGALMSPSKICYSACSTKDWISCQFLRLYPLSENFLKWFFVKHSNSCVINYTQCSSVIIQWTLILFLCEHHTFGQDLCNVSMYLDLWYFTLPYFKFPASSKFYRIVNFGTSC